MDTFFKPVADALEKYGIIGGLAVIAVILVVHIIINGEGDIKLKWPRSK